VVSDADGAVPAQDGGTWTEWRAAFQQTALTYREGYDGVHSHLTVVALDPAPEVEEEVMTWEDEIHVP
jgi:hypothetical protein